MGLLNFKEQNYNFLFVLLIAHFVSLIAFEYPCMSDENKKITGIGIRAGKTVSLEPDELESIEVFADYNYPWSSYLLTGFIIGTKSSISAGFLTQGDDEQLLTTLSQLLVITNEGEDISFDLGGGIAFIGNNRVGKHDFGGIFQFNYNFGVTLLDLYKEISLGYRWFHLSDAGIENGQGLNRHTLEIIYNF